MKNFTHITILCFLSFFNPTKAQEQFTNNGNFKIHAGGSISFFGDFINNGSLIDSGEAITLAGSSAQKIAGSSLTSFKNLTLNNSAGSYLSANEKITGELKITSGTFTTTGYDFTLVSDSLGTAYIAPILGSFSGNITMQRYLEAGPTSWRFLASPVSGVTINDWQDNFVTSGFPGSTYPNFSFTSVYTYDETVPGISDNGYNPAPSSNDPIIPGQGYQCYIGPVPLTIDVTGPPVKFNQTFPVTYSPSGDITQDGWVMIGNPYPSAIDWSSAAWTKNNINDAIYIWNSANQQYASWVAGVSTNGGSNMIASSQSFWIQTNGIGPLLSCTENIKISSNQPFLEPTLLSNQSLKLTINGNNFKDETILLFDDLATNSYDASMDARKLFSSNLQVPAISTLDSLKTDMSINSLPLITSATQIPVKTLVGVSGNYTISVDSSSLILSNFCIVLEDITTGIKTILNDSSNYTFFISDTTATARFILHVSATNKTSAISASCNNYMDGKAIAAGKGIGPWDYLWFNSTNNLIQQTLNTFLEDTLQNLAAGLYSVQIQDINSICGYFTKEITVTEPAPVYAGFTYLNDTLFAGSNDSLVLQNTSTGASSYLWDFGDGSVTNNSFIPPAHHYDSSGTYAIILIAEFNDCSDTVIQIVYVLADEVSTIEYTTTKKIKVYPNPFSNTFNIVTNEVSPIHIYDMQGVLIYSSILSEKTTEIDLGKFASGIYLVRILTSSLKIIKTD
ncbi:MAG: T9SS type A sorting domain-containing protein [Bacteroidota bacterium]|nr:T9SS type A sorting domain-containing protein [Bacteroidota bacterium]